MIDWNKLGNYGYTIQWYLTDVAKYLALWSISEVAKKYGIRYVLGGGTALNDIYFPRHRRRFSRDLDLYLVNVDPSTFLEYVNTVLRETQYYKEIDVISTNIVVQGLVYDGIRGNNVVYKFRLMLPRNLSSGIKFSDIVPANIKRMEKFNKWYMDNKGNLPRIYEIEVSLFRGIRKYANPINEKTYNLPITDITDLMDLPNPYPIRVFAIEDLVASKIEGIISALVAKGVFHGTVTGRRAVKMRDVYDLVIVFSEDLCNKEKLFRSLDILNIDYGYAFKAIRLAMLQAIIDPNKHRELTYLIPSLRGKLADWITSVLNAYRKTLDLYNTTPEDHIAYKITMGEEINTTEIRRKFNISKPQLTYILSKLEKLGFYINEQGRYMKNKVKL